MTRRPFIAAAAAAALASSLALAPVQAEARDRSGAIVAGAILGLAAGAVLGSALAEDGRPRGRAVGVYEPSYGYEPVQYRRRRPPVVYEEYYEPRVRRAPRVIYGAPRGGYYADPRYADPRPRYVDPRSRGFDQRTGGVNPYVYQPGRRWSHEMQAEPHGQR